MAVVRCSAALFAFVLLALTGKESLAQVSGSLTPGNNFNLAGAHRLGGNDHENVQAGFGLSGNTKGGPAQAGWNVDYNKGLNSAGVFGSHVLSGPAQNTVGARGNLNLFNGQKDRLDASAFASKSTGNVQKFGAGLQFNDHSASITKTNQPGVASATRLDGTANLFNSGANRLDANAFKSNTRYVGGPSIGSHGAGLNWNHANGHGASFGFDRTPALKETNVFGSGKANLWQSNDRRTSFDAFGSVSQTLSGPNRNKPNFGAGFGLSHRF